MASRDYGGQKVFYSLHHLFLTKNGVYLLIFDLRQVLDSDAENAFAYLSFWLNVVWLHAPNTPVLLVGTFQRFCPGCLLAIRSRSLTSFSCRDRFFDSHHVNMALILLRPMSA